MQVDTLKDFNRAIAYSQAILCDQATETIVNLVPIGTWIFQEVDLIETLVKWRAGSMGSFFTHFTSSAETMLSYLRDYSINDSSRILFLIVEGDRPIGHIGLSNIAEDTAELDNVIRGETVRDPNTMTLASTALIGWAFANLGVSSIYLKVQSTNSQALRLYKQLGFVEESHTPLRKIIDGDLAFHTPCEKSDADVDFSLVVMRLSDVSAPGTENLSSGA